MADFQYTALTSDGLQTSGTIDATDGATAKSTLESQNNLYVLTIKPQRSGLFTSAGRFKDSEFHDLIVDLVDFLKAGVPLIQALSTYADYGRDKRIKQFLTNAIEGLTRGQSFSSVCERHRDTLDDLFIINVKTGEETGNLTEALEEYQQYLYSKISIRRKVLSLIAYPAFLMASLFVILGLMLYLVLPSFTNLFVEQGTSLPLATQFLIFISHHLHWIALAVVLAIVGIKIVKRSASESVQGWLDKAQSALPFYGRLNALHAQFKFVRTLHTLVRVGIPLTEALNVILNTTRDRTFRVRLSGCIADLHAGTAITPALQRSQVLENKYVTMLSAAEETGQLDQGLDALSRKLLETFELKIELVMKLLEPVLVLLIGFIVGFTVLAMYLPIFSISDLVG